MPYVTVCLTLLLGVGFSHSAMAGTAGLSESELQQYQSREQALSHTAPSADIDALLAQAARKAQASQPMASALQTLGMKQLPSTHSGQPITSQVFVFTSLALPKTMFNQLVVSSHRAEVPLLIRGVLKGGLRPTIEALSKRMMNDKNQSLLGGVSIDPRRFKQFGIQHVPAFVVVKQGECQDTREPCDVRNFDVVYGSVSLSDALHLLASKGQFASELTPYLAALARPAPSR